MGDKTRQTSFSELALALANDYESIYVINSKDDSYVEYVADGDKELIIRSSGDNFYSDVPHNCKELVYPDDQEKFLRTFEKERTVAALDRGESFALNYRLVIDGKPQYYFLKTIRSSDEDIIIGVQNVDVQTRLDMKERESRIIYSEIAESLGGMFEVIYHINIENGHYTEFYSSQDFSELGIENGGDDDFFEKLKTDIRVHIHEEDREMLINEMDKDNLLGKLEEEPVYSLVYRQIIGGRVQYMNLIAFLQRSDSGHIVVGVRNIDEQKRQEENVETYGHIAGALASRYEVIYYIDSDTNEYTMYSASEQYARLGTTKKGKDFFEDATSDIKKIIHADDVERVLRVMNKDNLLDILAHEGSMSMSYRQKLDGETKYVSMIVVRPKNDDKHLVIAVLNIDAQIRREQTIKAESQSFNEISMALAQRYEVLYQVNIITDEYLEFSSSEKYSKLEVGTKGKDFFGDTQNNMKKDIFPEDYPMMAVAMQKSYLLESLKDTGKFIINYRLMLDGRPQYVSLLAVRPKEDSEHIIIAVANIDSARKMELEFAEALSSAMDMANNDGLTGLKNKRFYVQTEMRLDMSIEEKAGHNFAIVICDIDGLKKVNDTLGHKAGDEYIQKAASIMTDVFRSSTVYRIGGDEFVAILENEDYKNRDALMALLDAKIEENRESGLVTMAYGISEFKPVIDNRVQDVFERADRTMYANKRYYQSTEKGDMTAPADVHKQEKDMKYYTLFEQLISAMTDVDNQNIPLIEKILVEFGSMFRLSKAVTRLYRNLQEEKMGGGETLCAYDTGLEGIEVLSLRIVTKVMSVATMTVYMTPDEKPLTDLEKARVERIMRVNLTYLSRNRIRDMVEELTYFDDAGYRNLRSFQKYIMVNKENLGGKAAMMYNLRHFSLINRELSENIGDMIMKSHFETIESMIGDEGIVCRLGGDNFVAICGKGELGNVLTALDEISIVYDAAEGKTVNISTSVGVYRIPEGFIIENPGVIMEKIIVSIHVAQNGGKDRIVFYNGNLIENRDNALKVQQLFPEALRNEEFKVYYQPKVDIRNGEIIGAEALCRWFHDGRMVSPGDFIPTLEETNDICRLDFYMLDHVCRDIRRWMDSGKKVVRISVNMSRKHMINVNLLNDLLKIIDRHNVPHSCIEIELTETTTDVEFSDMKRVVTGLQNAGIYTSVDDFGVGYSSMNLIRELPWNVIKVDRSFLPVEGDDLDAVSKVMFKHVIAMTAEMGIECIVEGVETERQLNILRENNCNYAQGFLYDKPLPKGTFEEKLSVGFYDVK